MPRHPPHERPDRHRRTEEEPPHVTIKPDLTAQIPAELGAVHFVGIGGSGMSGIARLFLGAGHRVTGSDVRDSANIARAARPRRRDRDRPRRRQRRRRRRASSSRAPSGRTTPSTSSRSSAGCRCCTARRPSPGSSAASASSSVAGAHGKTTSTGMIITGLLELGEDPSFVNGGVIEELGVSAASGDGELFVVEADESDGSFLLYDTSVALITNVDPDHLDHYGSRDAFEQAFVDFADRARELVVISSDDAGATRVAARALARADRHASARPRTPRCACTPIETDGPVSFAIDHDGVDASARPLRIPGHHNAINAAGAFAVLVGLGFDPAASLAGIARFAGTGRRFELHGTVGGVSVYDDYAHHPTEVAAALAAARTVVGAGRIIAVHQPHTYSRTQTFAKEFAEVLEQYADETVVLDVYGAREDPVPGVTGALVSERFDGPGRASRSCPTGRRPPTTRRASPATATS